jgi:hypothetical protein
MSHSPLVRAIGSSSHLLPQNLLYLTDLILNIASHLFTGAFGF